MPFRSLFSVLPLALTLAFVPACGGEDDACSAAFPAAPAGATGSVHVAASCHLEDPDGSAERPFPTIQAGVDHASSGNAVLLAAGTYAENISIQKAISVVGAPDAADPNRGGIIVQAPSPNAVHIDGEVHVAISGLHIAGPAAVGIWVQRGELVVEHSSVEGAKASGGKFGYGVLASDGASLKLRSSTIASSESAGVLVGGAEKAIIVQNVIRENAGGGIRVDGATGEVSIEDNQVQKNQVLGIGIFSAKATVSKNTVSDTAPPGSDPYADGILVAALAGSSVAADVTVQENTVSANGRTGILFSQGAKGIIVQNSVKSNALEGKVGAGIWVQSGAGGADGIEISKNEVRGNKFVGIGVTGATRAIIVQNTAISETVLGSTFSGAAQGDVGDGIAIFDDSSAEVSGNVVEGNARFGLIADAAGASTQIDSNTFSKSGEYGIIVQNSPEVPALGSNMFDANTNGDSKVLGPADKPFFVAKKELELSK